MSTTPREQRTQIKQKRTKNTAIILGTFVVSVLALGPLAAVLLYQGRWETGVAIVRVFGRFIFPLMMVALVLVHLDAAGKLARRNAR